jgi:dethiobiotin synthetase/adenosylmethionine--8-amino-7-oxononanoate aminotransferase
VARARKIPIIYDEVFTGCWRLGVPTAGALLGQAPDIACYAKLLTGGVAPLAVTLSSEAVFDAFKGPTKVRDGTQSTLAQVLLQFKATAFASSTSFCMC